MYDYEFAKKSFEEHGFELIDKTYKNCTAPMRYRCPTCSNVRRVSLANLRQGWTGCRPCATKRIGAKRRKYDIESARRLFAQVGLELLEREYKNCTIGMRCICPDCGKPCRISLARVRQGAKSCKRCGRKRGSAKCRKYDMKMARRMFADLNLTLLARGEFKGLNTSMKCRCRKCKRVFCTDLKRVKHGHGCQPCSAKRAGATRQSTLDEAKSAFDGQDLELLETEYHGCYRKMRYRCRNCGYVDKKPTYVVTQGHGCPKCSYRLRAKAIRRSREEAADIFASGDMELLEQEYWNNQIPMQYRCLVCGHIGKVPLKSVLQGQRCKPCSSMRGERHFRWIEDREEVAFRKRIVEKCHGAIRNALLAAGKTKDKRWKELVGWTPEELREHITRHPNWRKIKADDWCLDHVFPIKAFMDYRITDIRVINALDNLQPLGPIANLKKGAKYSCATFERYLQSKGYTIEHEQ